MSKVDMLISAHKEFNKDSKDGYRPLPKSLIKSFILKKRYTVEEAADIDASVG
jgi:hypothetical protein